MDMYMYFGASTPIGVSTATEKEAIGEEYDDYVYHNEKPSKHCTTSRSVGDLKSDTAIQQSSPFRRAFSKSLRKHQSLKEKNCYQETKPGDNTPSIIKVVQPGGVFWRASKRLFSTPKVNSTASEKEAMPDRKAMSRDDAQISNISSSGRRQQKRHARQRTASPPSEISKEKKHVDPSTTATSSGHHQSPFRSLPNAKKTLKNLIKWPSMTPTTSSSLDQPTHAKSKNAKKEDANGLHNWKQYQAPSQSSTSATSSRGINSMRKPDVNHRLQECVKDLNVSLRFLADVVKKDKLLMLDGSASIILDTVLKLLLIMNEKRRRLCPQGSVENQPVLEAYNSVYHHLAALLKFADALIVKVEPVTQSDHQETAKLCKALKDSVQELLSMTTNEAVDHQSRNGSYVKKRSEEVDLRKSSSVSDSSTSSSTADWAAEDEGEARLQQLDNSFNNEDPAYAGKSIQITNVQHGSATESSSSLSTGRPVSSVSTSSSGCGGSTIQPAKPPSTLHLNQQQIMALGHHCVSPANTSNGSRSPPGSDSGIYSLNDTSGSLNYLCADNSSISNSSLLACLPATTTAVLSPDGEGSFLDEILAQLKLTGLPSTTTTTTLQDQQHSADGDVETVTEEYEEMVGDTKIIRKKIITRQKVRHQSVLTTRTTTHLPVIESPNSDVFTVLTSPALDNLKLDVPWQRRKSKDLEHAIVPSTAPPPPVPPRVRRPISDYDNDGQNQKPVSSKKILSTKQQQHMQHSASLQSFSRQTLLNGRLIKTETAEKFDASAMKASKSETFDEDGRVTERRGQGSCAEWSYAQGDRQITPLTECNDTNNRGYYDNDQSDSGVVVVQRRNQETKGVPPQPPPRPPKRSVVSSYVQLFGTGTPSNQADFRSSTLATYEHLRDRWNDHFESHKRRAMTYQFVSTPTSASTSANGVGTSGGMVNGKTDSPSSASSSSSSPKISVIARISKTRQEIEEDGEVGVPVWIPRKPQEDYQNLVNILNVNEYLKLPKQSAVEADVERKPLPFRVNPALMDATLLDEIDVKQYLICKKSSTDDGPEIRGGPVDALIVHATKTASDSFSSNYQHAHGHGFCYQEAFLTTYRTFVAPIELIRKLIYRYDKFNTCGDKDSVKKKAAKNTFSLLVRVVDDLSTVELNDDTIRLLSGFIYRMMADGELNFSRLLRQKLMERYKVKRQRALDECNPLYPTSIPGTVTARMPNLLDFKASLLAEQFTFLDWYYFQKIELSEMLLWAQEQSEEHSPNLTNFTGHFNKMSYWVRTRILEQTDQKERERIFGKFVKIMRHLRRLNNFNSCLALLSALDSGPIRRLEWPRAASEALNEHSSLIDSSQSFKTYRMELAEAKPPCLPYIGLILQDLTFVHIGNPNHLPPDQCQNRRDALNFAKRWQQYTILDNMRRFKAWPYGIKKSERVLSFFNDFDGYLAEDILWEISEKLKPRQQHTNIGVARRVVLDSSS